MDVLVSKILRLNAHHTPNQFAQISLFTNFVYVCQTSNHLGTTSLFTRSSLGKARKRTSDQTRRSSMILGFSTIETLS